MPAPYETEFKFQVADRAALDRVRRALGAPSAKVLRQTNWIFDTAELDLHRRRFLVRLRQENGRALLTAKAPSDVEEAHLVHRPELELEISQDAARGLIADTASPLVLLQRAYPAGDAATILAAMASACAGKPLRPCGIYETERTVLPVRPRAGLSVEVALDRTTFPGGRIDYEIEIELADQRAAPEVRLWAEALLRDAGVESRPSPPKVVRFFTALGLHERTDR